MSELIFGKNPVFEVLRNSSRIRCIYLLKKEKIDLRKEEILKIAEKKEVTVYFLPSQEFEKRFSFGKHQGIVAEADPFPYLSLSELISKVQKRKKVCLIVLDTVFDPQNLGAIIRSVVELGGDGIILRKRREAPVSAGVYKASAGACEYLDIARVSNLSQAVDSLKEEGFWVYGAVARKGEPLWEVDFSGKVLFVVGGEDKGISPLLQRKCDYLINIPIKEKVGSLNVSVAAAILLYEWGRKSGETLSNRRK
jgi:23S rRNA (guanosine2251-2'-O)-methyltransferase